jgi:hypothetical protein
VKQKRKNIEVEAIQFGTMVLMRITHQHPGLSAYLASIGGLVDGSTGFALRTDCEPELGSQNIYVRGLPAYDNKMVYRELYSEEDAQLYGDNLIQLLALANTLDLGPDEVKKKRIPKAATPKTLRTSHLVGELCEL